MCPYSALTFIIINKIVGFLFYVIVDLLYLVSYRYYFGRKCDF
jgi:hypothetical protein